MSRFTDLTREEIAELNRKATEQVTVNGQSVPALWIGGQEAAALAGIEEVKPETVPVTDADGNPVVDPETGQPQTTQTSPPYDFPVKVGKNETRRYRMTKNETNRPKSLENMKTIRDWVLQGRYALNGETMIVGDDDQGISLQHRCGGIFLASLEDPDVSVPILLVEGIPAEFADTADTGRSRSSADIAYRQNDILAEDELFSFDGVGFGPDALAIRKTLTRDLTQSLRLIYLRLCGKDVNASGKFGQSELFATHKAFGKDIETLVNVVYNHDVGRLGQSTFGKVLSRSQVIAALALWQSSKHSEPVRDVMERGSVSGSFLDIDLDECKAVLHKLDESNNDPDSDYGPLVSKIATANKSGAKQPKHYKFGSIVNLVRMMNGDEPQKTHGRTDTPIPREKSLTAKSYPHFGGADQPKPEKVKKGGDE